MNSFEKLGKPIVVASHRRSGTHLTIDLLRKQFEECKTAKKLGERLNRLYLTINDVNPGHKQYVSPKESLRILAKSARPIVKSHQLPDFVGTSFIKELLHWLNEEADFLYLVRDGRRVMTSLHLYEQSFNESARVNFSEFIRLPSIDNQDYNNVKWWANHVEAWMQKPNVKVLKYEDIVKETHQTLDILGDYLKMKPLYQMPLLPQRVDNIWQGRWNRLLKTVPESTAIIGYFKGQKTPKWQEAFQEEDYKFFLKEAEKTMRSLDYSI
jgi:hypothetical protein